MPAIVDLHNVYSTIADRLADESSQLWRRSYLRREARLLRSIEARAADVADALTAVSEDEELHFAGLGACVHRIPNGVDTKRFPYVERGDGPPTVLSLGAMSWEPNAKATVFLAREILPALRERIPGCRLQVVGRDPSADVRALAALPGVEVTGSVPDVVPYVQRARALAVPLDSGGGTRLKILEAFSAGLPVVSTAVGCEGIDAQHGMHLEVAERPAFVDAIARVLQDRSRSVQMARNARRLAETTYDWEAIGARMCHVAESLLRKTVLA